VHNHAPPGYVCPFCELAAGRDATRSVVADIVHRDEHTLAFIAAKWWVHNKGHVLVVPTEHFENVYDIPAHTIGAVYATAKRIAHAIRETYGCDGVSMRQHNEPAGNQEVWHFHVHVFPRYDGDELYERHIETHWTTPAERAPYAERLRAGL
jgi:histidine triad (HIT) family protein